MNPATAGTRIRVTGKSNDHSYQVGRVYTVAVVDNDGTFKARDSSRELGNWIRWADCEEASCLGWEFIKKVLPDEVIEFLSAFDGVECIYLKEVVKDEILSEVPDLQEEILSAVKALDAEDEATRLIAETGDAADGAENEAGSLADLIDLDLS